MQNPERVWDDYRSQSLKTNPTDTNRAYLRSPAVKRSVLDAHAKAIQTAIGEGKPVNAHAVDAYKVAHWLPKDYLRVGNAYQRRPAATTASELPLGEPPQIIPGREGWELQLFMRRSDGDRVNEAQYVLNYEGPDAKTGVTDPMFAEIGGGCFAANVKRPPLPIFYAVGPAIASGDTRRPAMTTPFRGKQHLPCGAEMYSAATGTPMTAVRSHSTSGLVMPTSDFEAVIRDMFDLPGSSPVGPDAQVSVVASPLGMVTFTRQGFKEDGFPQDATEPSQ